MALSRLPFASSIAKPAALVALALTAASLWTTSPAHAEPASCLLPDPSQWPAVSKPYFMLLIDTSGSMITTVNPAPSCGYPATRMGHAKCAVKNTVLAFSGEVNFGLAQYASFMTGCGANCYGNNAGVPNPACLVQCFNAEVNTTGICGACGPMDNVFDPTTRHGANVLVPMQIDNFWNSPPGAPNPTNVPTILSYVDNNCTSNLEVTNTPTDGPQYGKTPLNGALRDMRRYFQTGWTNPDNAAITYPTPLNAQDRPCRSLNVILVTDGDETCDTQQDAVNAAAALLNPGVTVGGNTFSIKTYVINFAGGSQANTDAIAAAGGTGASYFATNEVSLSSALASIVSGAVKPETCDNTDNNCNGCTDEGFTHYCNSQPVPANCCTWGTTAQRTTCLNNYKASITPANPKGNLLLLPCTTPVQVQPATWLCFDPGEQCDNVDNNCVNGVDEGITKCGSPLHCPQAETCNGQDDNCNGLIDEGNVCPNLCSPSAETCDGCDNDCNGFTDNGIAPIPCGLMGPGEPINCQGTITCKPSQAVPAGGCVAGGGFNACSITPLPETCNGSDDNCNGIIDDGVPSVPCIPNGAPAGLNYGPNSQCKQGHTVCTNGTTTCVGWIGPAANEICDGVDNNCNGQVDENPFGAGLTCGVNQPPCTPGTTACVNGALVCQGGVQPGAEICNGIDDNCNGQVDEAPLADAPGPGMNGCWNLPGNCCSFGALHWCPPPGGTCTGDGTLSPPCTKGTLACAGVNGWICQNPKDPSAETCDGIDNDCNGMIDDGNLPQVGQVCGTNVGLCKQGVIACAAGVLDCVGDVGPVAELCDGLDNDCDGTVDNGIPVGGACTVAYDTTAYPGDRSAPPCQPGVLQCNGMGGQTCVGGVGPQPEVCDGIDNDCDGKVDEPGMAPDGIDGSANPLPPPNASIGDACGSNAGECKQGSYQCVNGLFACLGGQAAAPETCDCLDNDCNGQVDDSGGDGGVPICGSGKDCVKSPRGACQCAAPCGNGEFPCPPGQKCEMVVSSQTGQPIGNGYCVSDPDANCGDCTKKTVKDANGKVLCAPTGTMLPGCITPPVCTCKGQNGCEEPCAGVTCPPGGGVCASFGPNAGKCAVDNCYNNPCQGCGKACNLGACVPNPCAAANVCPPDQECKPTNNFTDHVCVPACATVTCPSGKTCVDGACVDACSPACAMGQVCDLTQTPPTCVNNKCMPGMCSDGSCCDPLTGACGNCPCEGVVCPTGQACDAATGQCGNPQMSGAGGGGGGSATGTSSTATGATGASSSGAGGAGGKDTTVWGLATGGGGCACEVGSSATSRLLDPRLGLLALGGIAAALRRRRRAAKKGEEVAS